MMNEHVKLIMMMDEMDIPRLFFDEIIIRFLLVDGMVLDIAAILTLQYRLDFSLLDLLLQSPSATMHPFTDLLIVDMIF